jgi:hypothetical protein
MIVARLRKAHKIPGLIQIHEAGKRRINRSQFTFVHPHCGDQTEYPMDSSLSLCKRPRKRSKTAKVIGRAKRLRAPADPWYGCLMTGGS